MSVRSRRHVRHVRRWLGRIGVVTAVVVVVSGCSGLGFGARPTMDTTPVNPIRPRMTATPGPQHVAAAAFVDLVTAEDFSYRVSFQGGVGLSTAQLPIKGRMDVAGDDFRSVFTYDLSREIPEYPELIDVDVRGIDGRGYFHFEDLAWTDIDVGGDDHMGPPFHALTRAADVRHLGVETRDSGTFYRISVPGAVLLHPATIPILGSPKVRTTALELLVDVDGRPVIGTWRSENQARVGGQLQGVAYELRLTFSRLGEAVEISAP